MRYDSQQYLERLCEHLATDHEGTPPVSDAGIEPFALGRELRFSPTRTKAVMRELLQHNLLDLAVVVGSDGRNELQMRWNRETERWYTRTLRFRRVRRNYGSL